MSSNTDNRLARIRQSIVFGGALIPAVGSWLFAYRVLEATNPRVSNALSITALLIGGGILLALNKKVIARAK